MPIQQSKFQIDITTGFDGSGSKAAHESLNKVGEAAEHSAHSGRALTEALRSINPELGELGQMLHVSEFGAGFAGVMALSFAMQKLSEHIEAVTDKMKEAIAASIELKERFADAEIHATLEAAAAQQKFADALDAVARRRDIATEAMTRMIAVSSEQTKQTESLIDAELRLTQAQIQQAVARGEATPEAASKATLEIERQAKAAKDAAEDAQTQAEIQAKMTRGRIAFGEISADNAALGPLRGRAKVESTAIETQTVAVHAAESEREAAKKAIADAVAWAHDFKQVGAFEIIHGPGSAIHEARERKQDADKRLKDAEANLQAAERHLGDLKAEHDATQRAIDSRESEIKERITLTQNLSLEAAEIAEDLKRRQASRAQIDALNQQAQAVADAAAREARINAGKGSPDDIAIEQGYNAGRTDPRATTDAIAARFETARRNAAAQTPGANEELHALLEYIVGTIEALDEKRTANTDALKRRLQNISGHIQGSGSGY